MSLFEGGKELSQEQMESLVAEEISRRRGFSTAPGVAVAGAAGSVAGESLRNNVHSQASKGLRDEFQRIRQDPERQARQMDQMIRTYDRYLEKTGNPVEYLMDMPGQDYWAAGRLGTGEDVVFIDSSAPHPAVLAHELGHVNMNHSNDPLSFLQTSGLGRASGNNAFLLGGAGAALGALTGQFRARNRKASEMDALKSQLIGSGIGGAVGAVGASGMAAYEGEASRRALGYLPEDVGTIDAMGDLGRAWATYGMGGPGEALVTAMGIGSALAAAAHPGTRAFIKRTAGDIKQRFNQSPTNAPGNINTTAAGRGSMPTGAAPVGY
ncbi:hypothetical protein [Synechococcus sp. WH 8016]|uniref:hypothetical protein n=1 Tax=Synechococcus sp. WH 8016 TaxID=166318 RepID=UPI00022D7D6E|nr:hypothetical protein [Synechococcus sp. WH 8016]EHA63762.1 hypothetical protein Syn8016DRAFT_0803 [Synechococcus sp. WH 8016]